jgi:hypothetical protein
MDRPGKAGVRTRDGDESCAGHREETTMTNEATEPEFRAAGSVGDDTDGQVELALHEGEILMRVGGDPSGKILTFTKAELAAFIAGCKAGEFDDIGRPGGAEPS